MERLATARSLTTFDVAGLAQFARQLEAAELRGTACELDLSNQAVAGSVSPTAVRLSIPSVMVLSNLLVGRFRDVPLEVRIPDSRSLNLQLARGGFFFALANRSGVSWEGIGLDLVRRIAGQYNEGVRGVGGASSIRMVTNGDADGSATSLEWGSDSDGPDTATVKHLPIQGTLVWVTLGLEHRIPDQDSHQLELRFDEAFAG